MNSNSEITSQQPSWTEKITHPFIRVALQGDYSFGKFLGGALIILGFFLVGQAPLSVALALFGFLNGIDPENLGNISAVLDAGFNKNLFLLLAISAFMIGLAGIWVTIRFFHQRSFISLITPYRAIRWKRIFIAFGLYFLLTAVVEGASYLLDPENYIFQFQPLSFLILVLVSVVFLPFQTSFEEIFLRGYLMQAFGLLFRRTWPALIVTSLLFALMHSWNPEVEKFGFWVMFPYYFSFGLLLGFITLKDKSLEIALGVHAANNMFSSVFITFKGSALETDALLMQKQLDPASMMPLYLGCMFIFLLIISFVFGWWNNKRGDFSETPVE